MRRIIERVVTVVTTTTWKISWEADPPHPEHPVDSISSDLPGAKVSSETVYETPSGPDLNEPKEVDLPEREENITDQIAEELMPDSYPYQSKIERKSKP